MLTADEFKGIVEEVIDEKLNDTLEYLEKQIENLLDKYLTEDKLRQIIKEEIMFFDDGIEYAKTRINRLKNRFNELKSKINRFESDSDNNEKFKQIIKEELQPLVDDIYFKLKNLESNINIEDAFRQVVKEEMQNNDYQTFKNKSNIFVTKRDIEEKFRDELDKIEKSLNSLDLKIYTQL